MILRPHWDPAAERHLKDIGWHPAEFVDAAVIRFAATGRGDVEHKGDVYRLRIGPYRVWFMIDHAEGVMHVLGVYGPRRKL
jgi:mRNA-degrading endonuclease RelE of RelBE toxin-antitoxin system